MIIKARKGFYFLVVSQKKQLLLWEKIDFWKELKMEVYVICGILPGEKHPVVMVFKDQKTAVKVGKNLKETGLYESVLIRKEELI